MPLPSRDATEAFLSAAEAAGAPLTSSGGRVPPNELDAEAAVLSAVLLDPDAFDRIQDLLAPEHFYADANRRIFEAVLELKSMSGQPVDIVSVAAWLRDRNRLAQVGGTPYLAQLADATPAVAHVENHARLIKEKWRMRQLIATCHRVTAEGYAGTEDVQAFIDSAEQAVFDIARVSANSSMVSAKDAIHKAFDILTETARRGGGVTGIETGFRELDRMCSGLHPGDLYIVAGRPGMGKTAFVMNLAVNVCMPKAAAEEGQDFQAPAEMPGYGVLFCSLEMPKEQLAARLLASEARVDMAGIRSGRPQREDWPKLTEAAARLSRLPLWIDDTPALTLLDLRAKIRRLQAEISRGDAHVPAQKLGLVAVDYLQLMQGRRDAGSREQEISELSRGLKQLAKEMGVPVLALSQLNRAVETRTTKDKRPQLSDLRESGAIEQDADAIFFIYREFYYFKENAEKRNIAEIIIAKQRNGPTGTFETRYSDSFVRFDNLANQEYDFDEMDQFADVGA
ncbi:MAG TPA: replicative DNA helicase [Polyangiaceae bacterium]|nr:replicative DNA helicase [Polyangiaceae bacterium]